MLRTHNPDEPFFATLLTIHSRSSSTSNHHPAARPSSSPEIPGNSDMAADWSPNKHANREERNPYFKLKT